MKKIITVIIIAGLITSFSFSQIFEVDLNTRVSQSELIIEGKVMSKRSFWDKNHHNIYTASKIEVFKVFKGNLSGNFIEVITPGGTVGLEKEEVRPSLKLVTGQIGIFTLITNTVAMAQIKTLPKFEPYASVQGFIRYAVQSNNASDPFNSYSSIDPTLYTTISDLTNTDYVVVKPFSSSKKVVATSKAIPTISSFSPTTITAGTKSQLTINGTNFGGVAGTVSFSDADDGGSTFYDAFASQIVSWTNTQIVVEVPTDGGTGPIKVTNTDPSSVISGSTLTVTYSQSNAESDAVTAGVDVAYQTQHVDDNGSGGYTWQMFTDFDAGPENAAFVRALTSWTSCSGTKINWIIGATTATDVIANDGINIIRHDNGSELTSGVLGRCTSRYSGCFNGPSDLDWYVNEMDIVFDDGTSWNYTTSAPGSGVFDFESVAVHELGHGHQLGHVINTSDVMHFSISTGEMQRTPSANNLAAGNDVMSRSTSTVVCGNSLMTISALDDASFNYSAAAYCLNISDPTPTITGLAGGSFSSSPGGLSINSSTGAIDVSASTSNTYTVTYTTTAGPCSNSSSVSVTINALDDASFSYSATAYCMNDSDPSPAITGLTGGGFSSSPAGLSINPTTGAIDVSVSAANTYTVTYTTTGTCSNSSGVSVTINALDDASFSYSLTAYCINDSDPTPTIMGLSGGSFSAAPIGLNINSATGAIDVSASLPSTYIITYTTTGTCPNSSNNNVTINGLDDASFSYSLSAYCLNDSDPTPTITGLSGGSFSSSPTGLSINSATGAIDVSASTPNTYTVTYTTTAGPCSNSADVSVTLSGMDDASFSYSATAYCVNDSDPVPTITGLAGGSFSASPSGLSINSATGTIDVSTSTANTYTVTYTTNGTCPNNSEVSVTINGLDDASFSYSATAYCVSDSDPTPTITGLSGGSFSASPTGLIINATTGAIDVSASAINSYTITYSTTGTCPNSSDLSLSIQQIDNSVSVSGITITSNSSGSAYQWIDCTNSNAPISGATNQSFTPSSNGEYAVIVNDGVCIDTSVCTSVVSVEIPENSLNNSFIVYPNPTQDIIAIEFENVQVSFSVSLFSLSGQLIEYRKIVNSDHLELDIKTAAGIYFINISDENNYKTVLKIVKE